MFDEEIRRYLGADSIGYLDTAGMVRSTAHAAGEFCMACFNGDYPVPYNSHFDKLIMERRADRAQLIDRDARLPL